MSFVSFMGTPSDGNSHAMKLRLVKLRCMEVASTTIDAVNVARASLRMLAGAYELITRVRLFVALTLLIVATHDDDPIAFFGIKYVFFCARVY
jgi:hypothetical protein